MLVHICFIYAFLIFISNTDLFFEKCSLRPFASIQKAELYSIKANAFYELFTSGWRIMFFYT